MRFSRARYVTLCQQSLVTAAVLAVGVSAAGVKTLDIVPQPGTAGAREAAPGAQQQQTLIDHHRKPGRSKVDSTPVTPKVREVKVSGLAAASGARRAPRAQDATPQSTPTPVPSTQPEPPAAGTRTPHGRVVALSEPQPVSGYATVGVTWQHGVDYTDHQIAVQVRTEKDGTWSGWTTAAYHDDHGPDGHSSEETSSKERPGTDALVIGDVDQVQMRAETTDGSTPPDLKLAVIDPGAGQLTKQAPAIDTAKLPATDTADGAKPQASGPGPGSGSGSGSGDAPSDTVSLSAMQRAPKPYIYSRAQWGANEKMREQSRPNYGTVKTGFVHHTVNANNYSAAQVPALLRGIYAYHTQSRGWRDIGYNYLVDRFGRIWEGRWGGVDRAVVGAHTLGYNEVSFAMSAIGNFEIAHPPTAVLNAYAKLFAWKLSLYNIRADGTHLWVKNRYLNAINGHRDVGQTACPGKYLYAKIPTIRTLAQRIQNAAQTGTPTPEQPPSTFQTPTQRPITWTRQASGIKLPSSTNVAGDKQPDVVLTSPDGRIQVLPTGGQTGFEDPVTTAGHWDTMDLVAAVGDVTGDGKGDVLARLKQDGSTRVYAGDGAGHVAIPGIQETRLFQWARSVSAAGDWNHDGHNDVLMTDKYSRLWMIPGLGGGRFGRGTLLSRAWGGFTSTVVAGDLTGDGRPDLAAIHHTGYLYVIATTSSGTLGTRWKRRTIGTLYDTVVGGAGDMTGDKVADVAVRSSRTGKTAIIEGTGHGQLGGSLGWFGQTSGLTQLTGGQMLGSAQPDLVGVSKDGSELVVLPHNGRANLEPVLAGNLKVPGASQVLAVGDWNRDGRGDVIDRQGSGDVLVLRRGLADGRFVRGVSLGHGWRNITRLAAVGDVTGDGNPDLAGRTSSGDMRIFPGDGKNGLLAPRTAPKSLQTFNTIGAGAWSPLSSRSAWLSSDGSFVPYTLTGGDPGSYDWMIGPGDVDGDGRADMIARDRVGTLWLIPGTEKAYGPRRLIGTGFGGYRLGG